MQDTVIKHSYSESENLISPEPHKFPSHAFLSPDTSIPCQKCSLRKIHRQNHAINVSLYNQKITQSEKHAEQYTCCAQSISQYAWLLY